MSSQGSDRPIAPPLILLGNDQEWAARSLESLLGPQGFATVRAYTGKQLLDLVRGTRVDAIVLDLGLPDMSGLEVVRRLAAESAFSPSTPVILLTTGAPTRAQRLEAYRAGAWELLSEPYDIEALVEKLRLFLRARREADRAVDACLLDAATGLYNARGIARRSREIAGDVARRKAPLCCIALAATVEDAAVGDEKNSDAALVEWLAEVCQRHSRVSDLVGRLGRTEIVIVAPDTTREGAEALVERVRAAAIDAPARVGNQLRRLVVRASLVAVPDVGAAASDVVSFVLQAASHLRSERHPPTQSRAVG